MIYLISRISPDAHAHNQYVANTASVLFDDEVFIPHLHNPFNTPHEKLQFEVFNTDLSAMKQSNIAVVSLPVGSDCSGEVGWFSGSGKYCCSILIGTPTCPIQTQVENLKVRWMIKGFLSEVFVADKDVYEYLSNDPIISNKVTLI